MEEDKNLEQSSDKSNEKLHISDVSDSISTKPIKCTICFNKDQDKITNIIKGEETNAWFCLKCGGLVGWIK
jgi:hypothetical protein